MQPDRQIFREQALKQYAQKQEKEVALRLLSTSIFAGLWLLFVLFLLITLLVLRIQIPRFISGPGIIQAQYKTNLGKSDDMVVLTFLPATIITQFHIGQQAIVQSRTDGLSFAGTIQYIGPGPLSPGDLQRRYLQNSNVPLNITQPSFIAEIKPAKQSLLSSSYEGIVVSIQINAGTQSVLSLLPGISTLLGD